MAIDNKITITISIPKDQAGTFLKDAFPKDELQALLKDAFPKDELKTFIRDTITGVVAAIGQKDVMSFKETMEFLGVSRSWLNSMMREGKLPYRKVHGKKRIFFLKSEIMLALEEGGIYKKLQQLK